MFRDIKSVNAPQNRTLSVSKSSDKENSESVALQQRKSLGAIPKQFNQTSVKKARPRLVSIENITEKFRIKNFVATQDVENFSPTLEAAGIFQDSRFTVYNVEKGTTVIRSKLEKKFKPTAVKNDLKVEFDDKKLEDKTGDLVGVRSEKKSPKFSLPKIVQIKEPDTIFPEVFDEGDLAAGYSFQKTPAKFPPKVDDLSQKSKFKVVKHFFSDVQQNGSSEKVKKVLKRRMSGKMLENLAHFEVDGEKGVKNTVKSTVVILPVKRIQELKDQDKKLKETPEDTKGFLPPLQNVKKVRCEVSNNITIKKKVCNPFFYGKDSIEYVKDHLKFFEEKECNRQSISSPTRRLNISSTQRQILVKNLININKQFNYPGFLTYNAVRLLDDVLSLSPNVPVEMLQLIQLTSLWIVLKKDHIFHRVPLSENIAQLSSRAYSKNEIVQCERQILKLLNFEISYTDVASTVNLCIVSDPKLGNINFDDIYLMYYFSGYMIDVSLFDEELMKESAMLLASTIAELSVVMNMSKITSIADISTDDWTPSYGKCFPEKDRVRVRSLIIRQILKSFEPGTTEHIVYLKYKRSRYGAVSKFIILKLENLV
ncbi:GSCOCG00000503001-RA-CDS [Cotesia congregata]|nr:GSCOCG00000503001-RA-CDS [Cotesia congregata]